MSVIDPAGVAVIRETVIRGTQESLAPTGSPPPLPDAQPQTSMAVMTVVPIARWGRVRKEHRLAMPSELGMAI